jgi:hypothetical protein
MVAELGSPAHPDCAHHKDDLREYQIKQAEFFFKDGAALLNISFELGELRWGRRFGTDDY